MQHGRLGIQNGGMRNKRALRFGLGPLVLALILGGAVLSRSGTGGSQNGAGRFSDGSGGVAGSPAQSGQNVNRKLLDRLIGEQKYEEAAKEAARIRGEARRVGDEKLWAWALIREVQLRTALHGYETAVRFLREEPWPGSPVPRAMLDLFYAGSLVTYRSAYSWEIGSRERVESAGPIDLKSWTTDQINAEAWSALIRVWKERDRLAALKASDFPDIWNPGDYPAGIRDTVRDSVVYLMAGFLADTSSWTPRQSNETWLLDLERLLSSEPSDPGKVVADLESAGAHPLEKLRALLAEHGNWCRRSAGRPEGALEARLELFSALHASFSKEDDRALIRSRLSESLAPARKHPWWASGQALLAEFTRAEDAPDALVRARKLALEGAEAYPDSPGGRRCLHVARGIEAPDFSVEMMAADAPGRRSVRFTHRNLAAVHLRAYPVDLAGLIRTSKDYNLFPQWDEAKDILEKGRPAASWKLDLPATPDFRDHRTYVELPSGLAPGLYLVAASARGDFARNANRIRALNVIVGDLVMLRRASGEGGTDAVVLAGGTGRPVAGAAVDLYAFDWQKGHSRVEAKVTDAEGRVHFAPRAERQGPFFLLATKGRDLAIDPDYLYLYAGSRPAETSAALIYTDRSIYRPGQKLYWKVLGYRGRRDLGKLRPAANAGASIWLEDINGQRVAEATCALNGFGTASGEFIIPAAGRPLGAWRLRTSPDGVAQVRVEEYKRPTFEVAVKDPDRPLRLNRPATLKGEARYYFGLPVASGAAVWQVKRERIYPRWWWWEAPDSGSAQVVAGGKVPLREDGTVEVTFTPRVDERGGGPGSGLTYRYTLSVDVTDEGGETRTASRSFRLGFVSVEAAIAAANGFGRTDARSAFTITRADLNGTPKPGKGSWRVVRLLQPETTLLPADQPLPEPPTPEERETLRTAGDRLRPRWESPLAPENILRLWKEGPEAARGTAEHGADGLAAVSVQALEAGAYRFIYETKDDFGAVCRESLDFLVSGRKASARLPLLLVSETASVPVGGTARLLLHSGFAGQPMLFETFKGGEPWERRWLEAGKDGGLLEIPVTEDLRGGFGARVTLLRDHQLISEEANIFVPWDNKELALSFSSFRDKLAPGGRETWRVTVRTPEGKPAVQGAAELLAYMYDRSLDLFAPHNPPRIPSLYPYRAGTAGWNPTLGLAPQAFSDDSGWAGVPSYPVFRPDQLVHLGGYGIGGPGIRGGIVGGVLREDRVAMPAAAQRSMSAKSVKEEAQGYDAEKKKDVPAEAPQQAPEAAVPLRANFSETAFWQPHLLTGPDGTAAVEFTVPDSVTGWRVFVHGVTKDLAGGTPRKGSAHGEGPHGQALPAALLPRGRPGRAQGRGQRRGRDGPLRRRVPRDHRPGHGREPGAGVRAPGEHPPAAVHREAGRRHDGRLPSVRAGAGRYRGLQSHGTGRGVLRRRIAAASRPARADAPRPITVRDPEGGDPPRADVPRPGEDRRPDAHQRTAGRHGGRSALLRPSRSPSLPRQLSLRMHGANSQPLHVHGHPDEPLRQISFGRPHGPGPEQARNALRDVRCGRSQPEDGPRRDAVARRRRRAAGTRGSEWKRYSTRGSPRRSGKLRSRSSSRPRHPLARSPGGRAGRRRRT